jgi:hypothetical protein
VTTADLARERAAWPEWMVDEYEERAALVQYGCKVAREESERMAHEMVKAREPARTEEG